MARPFILKPGVLARNGRDGSIAFRALNTSVRKASVCANALTLAFRTAGADSISVRNTEGIRDCPSDAQGILGLLGLSRRRRR